MGKTGESNKSENHHVSIPWDSFNSQQMSQFWQTIVQTGNHLNFYNTISQDMQDALTSSLTPQQLQSLHADLNRQRQLVQEWRQAVQANTHLNYYSTLSERDQEFLSGGRNLYVAERMTDDEFAAFEYARDHQNQINSSQLANGFHGQPPQSQPSSGNCHGNPRMKF
jgi:hypothetical protein